VTAGELMKLIDSGAPPAILDVRTLPEFEQGHVPGASNLPFQRLSSCISELPCDRSAPVVVYCGHGPRAWIAGRALRRLGFTDVRYLRGHMAAWRRAGLPEVSGPSTAPPAAS
jgi:rhodanese-related sulfurtransferase